MRLFGLIGYPLTHSFSKSYFTSKFQNEGITDARYDLFPINDISELPGLIEMNKDLQGLNVTIPYKERVLAFLDETEVVAREAGAVNTIKIIRSGSKFILQGYNSDVFGFSESLKPLLGEVKKNTKALILGTGGASKAVRQVLINLGFDVIFVSRKPSLAGHISYEMITRELIEECKIIVNTSPVGMYPHIDEYPAIPYQYLSDRHLLYDLVYNPEVTLFLQKGRDQGAKIKNGLQMLYLQAEKSWEIWSSPSTVSR